MVKGLASTRKQLSEAVGRRGLSAAGKSGKSWPFSIHSKEKPTTHTLKPRLRGDPKWWAVFLAVDATQRKSLMNDVPRRLQPPTTCRMVTVGHAHVHHLLRQLFIFGCWPSSELRGAKCKQMYRAHRRGPRGSSRGVEIDCYCSCVQ